MDRQPHEKYLSLGINIFKGVNLNVAPTLIEDFEARQILNLRVEKTGKLVTRNGYFYGVFVNTYDAIDLPHDGSNLQDPYNPSTPGRFDPTYVPLKHWDYPGISAYGLNSPFCGYPVSCGVLSFGEFKLENFWEEIDTDRILVVAIRHPYYAIRDVSNFQNMNWKQNVQNHLNDITQTLQQSGGQWTDALIADFRRFGNLMELLFIPLTGRYKNLVLDPYYLFSGQKASSYSLNKINILTNAGQFQYPGFSREISPQSIGQQFQLLFAPNRLVPYPPEIQGFLASFLRVVPTATFESIRELWEHRFDRQFLKMTQYRNYLVISDPVNGDMFLTDDFDWQDDCEDKYHRLRLAPNALERFWVDHIKIDLRLGEGEENDLNRGVKTGMALYRFRLPRKYTKVNVDYFDPTLTDGDFLFTNPLYTQGMDDETKNNLKWSRELNVVDYVVKRKSTTLLVGVARSLNRKTSSSRLPNDPIYLSAFHQIINNSLVRIFSNTNDSVEFDDILGELELYKENEKITDEEGNEWTGELKYADVYIWEDYKIQYFPTLGKDDINIVYPYLLREFDRFWDKANGKTPRVTRIKPKRGVGKNAPLGTWQYKFVWDFGNGVFSAPSVTMTVPDIMWSAIKDSEIVHRLTQDYERFYNQSESPTINYTFGINPTTPKDYNLSLPYFNPSQIQAPNGFKEYIQNTGMSSVELNGLTNYYLYRMPLFDSSSSVTVDNQNLVQWNIVLTRVGQLVWDIKKKLYGKTFNRYGNSGYYYTSNDQLDINSCAIINPMVIVDFFTMITCFFSKTDVATKGFAWQYVKLDAEKWKEGLLSDYPMSDELKYEIGPLVIPIFYHPDSPPSRFSVFDHDGRLRLSILAPKSYPNYPLILTNKFYTLPWVFINSRELTDFLDQFTIVREPFFPWMQMYLMFYSDIDYNNLEPEFFLSAQPEVLVLSSHCEGPNDPSSKTFIPTNKIPLGRNPNYVFGYVLRPTAPLRATRTEQEPNRLNLLDTEIPNDVKSRMVLEGVLELKLLDRKEFASLWGRQDYYTSIIPDYRGVMIGFLLHFKFGDFFDDFPTWFTMDYYLPGKLDFKIEIGPPIDFYVYFLYRLNIARLGSPFDMFLQGFNQNHETRFEYSTTPFQIRSQPDIYRNLPAANDADRWYDYVKNGTINNVDVYIYGQAERLILLEQLSAYFPSSFLFKAPRIAIRIPESLVPRKAKKLLIFRTKSTNDNTYNPDEFGFVKEVEFIRNPDGSIVTRERRNDGTEVIHQGEIYFFDTIKDDQLDFSHTPDQYEGLRNPIKSRFNVALNERVYYYNFVEEYQPETPRMVQTNIPINGVVHPNDSEWITNNYYMANIAPTSILYYVETDSQSPTGYDTSNEELTIEYAIVYSDSVNIKSQPTMAKITLPQSNKKIHVVLCLQPTRYRPDVKLKIYRKIGEDSEFYLIGEVLPEDEGILVDDNLPAKERLDCIDPIRMEYHTGLRWSKPYRPDWIEEDAFTEYKGGNIGTGLEVNYGNLVLFTDSSIARYTVQAENPPISRVDEITPEFGCIAPNSLVNNNNILFFLTWKGWMSYNNNVFKNIDDKFNNELTTILKILAPRLVRDITSGINPMYNELYLNFPPLPSNDVNFVVPEIFDDKMSALDNGNIRDDIVILQKQTRFDFGDIPIHNHYRLVWGHIYVQNYLQPYSTKFGYLLTLRDKRPLFTWPIYYCKKIEHPLEPVRLYFVDSFGNMWSGDIYPNAYGYSSANTNYFYWAAIYLETPTATEVYNTQTQMSQPLYRQFTTVNDYNLVTIDFLDEDVYPLVPGIRTLVTRRAWYYDFRGYQINNLFVFPIPLFSPVKWMFASKYFSEMNETNLKRIRKTLFNLYTKGNFAVNIETIRIGDNDTNIEDYNLTGLQWENWYSFDPSENFIDPLVDRVWTGRFNSIISVVPTVQYSSPSLIMPTLPKNINDFNVKPTKVSLELYGRKYAQINEIEVIWRFIHKYLL